MKVILSGCSGGGKSTLLAELARRGYATVPEPGLRLVRDPAGIKPWDNLRGFVAQAIDLAQRDLARLDVADPERAGNPADVVFFDRGLGDALAAWDHVTGAVDPRSATLAGIFAAPVFMAPPWRQIHEITQDRRHDWAQAVAEYDRLCAFYPRVGLPIVTLPKAPVAARADFVLAQLGLTEGPGVGP